MAKTRATEAVTPLLCAATALMAVACQRPLMDLPGQRRAVNDDAPSCQRTDWTPPRLLLTPPASTRPVARNPAIVADARGLYVLGNNVPSNALPVRAGETLTAWRVGHGSIGAPTSDHAFVFISPKATLDETGRLHVLWAEPPEHEQTIPPYQWILLRTSSLWAAAYEPERGWSPPTRIYSGAISWNWRVTSGPIAGGVGGESLIAVPNDDYGVLVLALEGGRWTVMAIPDSMPAAYVSVLGLGQRRLLAVVKAGIGHGYDRNSVFLYGQDGEGPWRLMREIQRSGTQAAMEVRLVKGAGGRVHLVWRQTIREDHFVIRHTQSDDGGASWTEPSDLLPGGLMQSLEAAVDRCGRLHVVYEDWSEGSFSAVRMGYATWDGGWSRPQRLHPSYVATDLTLVPRRDGSLMLAFYGTSGRPNDPSGWAMRYSEPR